MHQRHIIWGAATKYFTYSTGPDASLWVMHPPQTPPPAAEKVRKRSTYPNWEGPRTVQVFGTFCRSGLEASGRCISQLECISATSSGELLLSILHVDIRALSLIHSAG